jgi:hypothetical protein
VIRHQHLYVSSSVVFISVILCNRFADPLLPPAFYGGGQKEGQTVHVQELARDWLHNLGEISAGARGASDALAAADLVEGALAKLVRSKLNLLRL